MFVGQVLNALHNLPEARSETTLLVDLEGLPYSQAGEWLQTATGRIMSGPAAARFTAAKLRSPREASPPRGQPK